MNYLVRLLIFYAFLAFFDFYTFQVLRTLLVGSAWKMPVYIGYWAIHGLYYVGIAILMAGFMGNLPFKAPHGIFNTVVTGFVILYIPKLLVTILLLGEDLFRGGAWTWDRFASLFSKPESVTDGTGKLMSRSRFLSMLATGLAAVPFLGFIYGVVRGRYNFMVKTVQLKIKDLPASFEGFKIAQFSDFHIGSLNDREEVARGIDLVNKQNADVIFFTGDLVNLKADEVDGWEDILSRLEAPQGVYSILGNHDYGDYVRDWKTPQDKVNNLKKLIDTQEEMGWKMLLNENKLIEKDGEKLAVIGVENWSARANFGQRGNLAAAIKGAEDAKVKLLLSHDPSHWDGEVKEKYPEINAMFSGHTHGFQFGIDSEWLKWSPVQYVYKQWAGLYKQGEQFLYVNRGFGFNGYAGRWGVRPEVTVFELAKA